jgi:hypothetical protein
MESTNNSFENRPDNNLVWAILCTVMCCLPLGIVAIIKATKVNELWAQGDHEGARKAADDAKKYSIWGAVSVGIFLVLYILLFIVWGIGASILD